MALTPFNAIPHPTGPAQVALRAWTAKARADDGRLVTQFKKEYTMTVTYTDAQVAAGGVDESSLRVAYWDGAAWVEMPSTADPAANRVTLRADHFTDFALVGRGATTNPGKQKVYLPFAVR